MTPITETNLLEIRRRHPRLVRVRTFPKPLEAKNGADWEWHVVGRRRTLKMRVQAKRLQRNGVLKVRHKVKSSGKQQRDLLIAGAGKHQNPWGQSSRHRRLNVQTSTSNARSPFTRKTGSPFDPTDFGAS